MQLTTDQLLLAVERHKKLTLQSSFDPIHQDSRPTKAQQEVLDDLTKITHRYVTAGNQSGKSQLAARECAWILTETHPNWKRPNKWGDETLQLMVVGRTSKQVEHVLWRKIEQFLPQGSYREVNQGGALQSVIYKPNGNTIIFGSHHNDNEAREKLQAFTAHYVWLDELPRSARLIEELHRRIQAKQGYFLATFTPKAPNQEIKQIIDTSIAPYAKKYQFSMLDNPIYDEEQKLEIMDSLKTYSEEYRKTILYGDWAVHDLQVFYFDPEQHIESPKDYHESWRHIESVDPAMKSKFGYTLWAQDPNSFMWYLIKAEYITGLLAPDDVYRACLRLTGNVNVVRYVCDPHEAWYIGHAQSQGTIYQSPFDKNSRKMELIKNAQTAMGTKFKIAPWCTKATEELDSAQWSESLINRIVNGSSYHILDCIQYFVDCMPKPPTVRANSTWHEDLRRANTERKKNEKKRERLTVGRRSRWQLSNRGLRRLS